MCIIPSVNLVKNVGFSKDAIHCTNIDNDFANLSLSDIMPLSHPKTVEINKDADNFFFKKYNYKSALRLLYRFLRRNLLSSKKH